MKKPQPAHPQTVRKPTPAFARLLEEADQGIQRLEPGNPYRLYEFLHTIARRIAPVDAFQVCLYSHADQILFFPYNMDGDIYTVPVTLLLDDGPISQVIREGIPLVWNCEAQARAVKGLSCRIDRPRRSAMLAPIRLQNAKIGLPPLGVLTCHADRPQAYPPEAVRALQWLADRAGMALTRERDEAAWRCRLKAGDGHETEPQRPLVALTNEFVAMLQRLVGQIEAVRRLLPENNTSLADAVDRLRRECYQAQTQANQLSFHPRFCPPVPPDSPLAQLTPSEAVILEQIAHGKSNRAIAEELCVAEDTVKFHCKHIFQKLEVSSRAAAARVWLTSCLPKS